MKILGTFIDAPRLGEVRIFHDYSLGESYKPTCRILASFVNSTLAVIDKDGFIQSFCEQSRSMQDTDAIETIHIPKGSFVLPSFCDLHLHAPQFLYQGTGLDLPLMEWLDRYTYRAEERIDSDPELASRTYTTLAKRLKENGTGAVLLFGTIKTETKCVIMINYLKKVHSAELSLAVYSLPILCVKQESELL